MRLKFRFLGINCSSRKTILDSLVVAGVLIPLDKVLLLSSLRFKNTKKRAKQLANNFERYLIKITPDQLSSFDVKDLQAKAFYEISSHFGFPEKTIVYAYNFEESKDQFFRHMEKLNFQIKRDNWVIAVKQPEILQVAEVVANNYA